MGQATQLYKQLLRYGQTLKLTDRNYFYRRIRYVLTDNIFNNTFLLQV